MGLKWSDCHFRKTSADAGGRTEVWSGELSENRHSERHLGPGAASLRGKGLGFLVGGVRVKGKG